MSRRGRDEHYLRASLNEDGGLELAGQNLGPGTAMVSPDGEYEYSITVKAEHFPTPLALLDADARADLLDVLAEHWTGKKSYELQRLITDRVPMSSSPTPSAGFKGRKCAPLPSWLPSAASLFAVRSAMECSVVSPRTAR